MASHCSSWSGPPSWMKYCHACWRSYHSGFNSHESRCRIYTILKKETSWIYSGAHQMLCWHSPCKEGLLEINCRPWNPTLLSQLTLRRPQLPALIPYVVKEGLVVISQAVSNIYSMFYMQSHAQSTVCNMWEVSGGLSVLQRIYLICVIGSTYRINGSDNLHVEIHLTNCKVL